LNDNLIHYDIFIHTYKILGTGKPKIISYYGKLFDELKLYGETKYIMHKRFLMDKLTEKSISIIPKQIDYDILRISSNAI